MFIDYKVVSASLKYSQSSLERVHNNIVYILKNEAKKKKSINKMLMPLIKF